MIFLANQCLPLLYKLAENQYISTNNASSLLQIICYWTPPGFTCNNNINLKL
jgi:hypothetical protein